jgi:hypothetical protein
MVTSPMNKAPKQFQQQQQQNMHQKQQQHKTQWTPQRPQKSRSNGSTPSSSSSSTPNGKNSSRAVKRVNSSPVAAQGGGGGGGSLHHRQQQFQQQQQHQQQQQFRTPTKNIPVRKQSCHTPRASPARASQTPSPRAFAGSKCYEPPTPQSLPKPPSTWMQMASSSPAVTIQSSTPAVADDPISQHLRLLLKVHN